MATKYIAHRFAKTSDSDMDAAMANRKIGEFDNLPEAIRELTQYMREEARWKNNNGYSGGFQVLEAALDILNWDDDVFQGEKYFNKYYDIGNLCFGIIRMID